jgi:hypothetical protein
VGWRRRRAKRDASRPAGATNGGRLVGPEEQVATQEGEVHGGEQVPKSISALKQAWREEEKREWEALWRQSLVGVEARIEGYPIVDFGRFSPPFCFSPPSFRARHRVFPPFLLSSR